MPTDRMAPPPGASPPMRMTASWSGPQPTYRIQVCGVKTRLKWRVPLGPFAEHRSRGRELCKSPVAVHPPSACSGVKALPNTSPARRQSRQALLAFRSLDAFCALRELDRRRRDEEQLSRSEQRTGNKPKNDLTGKAPYKFESISPPAASLLRTDFSRGRSRAAMDIAQRSRPRPCHIYGSS